MHQRAPRRPAVKAAIATFVILLIAGFAHGKADEDSAREDAETAVSTPGIAVAPEPQKKRRYAPPTGFGGYNWGTPLRAFKARLDPDPLYAQIAYSQGKVTDMDMQCVPSTNPLIACDLEASLRTYYERREGEGYHALAEYIIPEQGFHLRNADVMLHPVTYMFCANWAHREPKSLHDELKLCGIRFYFRSENEAELTAVSDDVLTNYERVLDWLRAEHGDPERYSRRGRVIIRTPNEVIAPPRKRRFRRWEWCSVRGRELAPSCDASIVLTIDLQSGTGMVLFVTAPAYAFAYARRYGGADDDPMYQLLHGPTSSHVNHICTGTHLCRPENPSPMAAETLAKFRARPDSELTIKQE